MRSILLFIFQVIFFSYCNGQNAMFDTLLKQGKAQFDKKIEHPDYNIAVDRLKKAVLLNPNNSEAHYFLGYAYSRVNSTGGSTIPMMHMLPVLLASKELEKVNSLTPLYNGELIVLDPYSKITSEWGALALSYIVNHKIDSARWAFSEGKKRGGFDEFILALNRLALNRCSKNSILISCGDNYTFPLFYLQVMEKLRTDVVFIDVDMINTEWYPRLLEQTTRVKFGLKEPFLDTLDYKKWADSTITIPVFNTDKTFKWTLKPTYDEQYILRGDRILLSLLEENKFRNDIFFTKNFAKDEQLGLSDYLLPFAGIDKLNVRNEQQETIDQYIKGVQEIISSIKYVNVNSVDELTPIDGIRYDIVEKIEKAKEKNFDETGYKLLALLKNYLPLNKFPSHNTELVEYLKSNGIN